MWLIKKLKFFLNFKLNTSKISVGKASHSPNKKSVLGPGIESLLRNLKNRYPGFISSCEDYSQETGLVTTNFYSVIFINIGQPLTQNII